MGMFKPPTPPMIHMPPSAHPPTLANSLTQLEEDNAKKRASAAEGMGFDDTVKTSPQGLQAPATAKTTLLGG